MRDRTSFRHIFKKVGLWPTACGIALATALYSCAVFPQAAEDYTVNPSRSEEVALTQKRRAPSKKARQTRPAPKNDRVEPTKRKASTPKAAEKEKAQKKSTQVPRKKVKNGSSSADRNQSQRSIPATEMKERLAVVEYARKYKGVRYRYGGTNPFGFDCSGFTSYVFKKIDIFLPRNTRAQAEVGEKIPLQNVAPGDLLFFGEKGQITHVAIVTANEGDRIMMIHSTNSKGVVEEDLLSSDYWMERFLFARNIIGS